MASDYEAISTTIFNYFDGLKNADRARLEKAFAVEVGHMKGYVRDKDGKMNLSSRPINEVIDGWVKRTPTPEMQGRIIAIHILSPVAAIAVFDFNGIYIDTFQLAKVDSGWRIVNKFYVDQAA
jgi:Putative lumazine-binding